MTPQEREAFNAMKEALRRALAHGLAGGDYATEQACRNAVRRAESIPPKIESLESSLAFYKSRVMLLEKEKYRLNQHGLMLVVDILANCQLLPDPDGTRYGKPPSSEEDIFPNIPPPKYVKIFKTRNDPDYNNAVLVTWRDPDGVVRSSYDHAYPALIKKLKAEGYEPSDRWYIR